jgi:hypothetical protein
VVVSSYSRYAQRSSPLPRVRASRVEKPGEWLLGVVAETITHRALV